MTNGVAVGSGSNRARSFAGQIQISEMIMAFSQLARRTVWCGLLLVAAPALVHGQLGAERYNCLDALGVDIVDALGMVP